MNSVFTRAALMQTAIKGFFKTGICPLDRNIFPEHMYEPSDTTDRPEAASEPQPSTCGPILQQEGAVESQFCKCIRVLQPSFRRAILMPSPKEIERTLKKNSCRRKGKTVILTSSPYKKELAMKKKSKEARKESQNKKLPERKNSLKRKLAFRTKKITKENKKTTKNCFNL
ncbi:hypothetical protein J437_LFUL008851 [Ladona fulva]|uniref:Uncharacterized protein n=1 Tax=Ladona fulva TaxID=123851 RepID=A0A8K0KAE2_LADFU|nr:hypothetical protein J437_LFUL008851 [Ladona fulva]